MARRGTRGQERPKETGFQRIKWVKEDFCGFFFALLGAGYSGIFLVPKQDYTFWCRGWSTRNGMTQFLSPLSNTMSVGKKR